MTHEAERDQSLSCYCEHWVRAHSGLARDISEESLLREWSSSLDWGGWCGRVEGAGLLLLYTFSQLFTLVDYQFVFKLRGINFDIVPHNLSPTSHSHVVVLLMSFCELYNIINNNNYTLSWDRALISTLCLLTCLVLLVELQFFSLAQ